MKGIKVVRRTKAELIEMYEKQMAEATGAEREKLQQQRDFWMNLTQLGEAEIALLVDLSGRGRGAP